MDAGEMAVRHPDPRGPYDRADRGEPQRSGRRAPGELDVLEQELAKIPIHGNRTDEDIMKLRELLQR
jgi:hypothetical protein